MGAVSPNSIAADKTSVDAPVEKNGEPAPAFGLKKLLGLLIVGAILLPVVHFSPLGDSLGDIQAWREKIDGDGITNEIKFVGIVSVLIALGAPRLMFFALGGLVFGLVEGFLAATAASMIGSYATFVFIRWAGRDWITARLRKNRFFTKITRIRPNVMSVFVVRQLPVSGIFINATLALSTVRSRAFLIGSFLGFLPQGVVAALIGSGVSSEFLREGALHLVAAGAALAAISFCVWRFTFRKPNSCAVDDHARPPASLL